MAAEREPLSLFTQRSQSNKLFVPLSLAHLECPVLYELFYDPVTILGPLDERTGTHSCGHTFSRDALRCQSDCPTCRALFKEENLHYHTTLQKILDDNCDLIERLRAISNPADIPEKAIFSIDLSLFTSSRTGTLVKKAKRSTKCPHIFDEDEINQATAEERILTDKFGTAPKFQCSCCKISLQDTLYIDHALTAILSEIASLLEKMESEEREKNALLLTQRAVREAEEKAREEIRQREERELPALTELLTMLDALRGTTPESVACTLHAAVQTPENRERFVQYYDPYCIDSVTIKTLSFSVNKGHCRKVPTWCFILLSEIGTRLLPTMIGKNDRSTNIISLIPVQEWFQSITETQLEPQPKKKDKRSKVGKAEKIRLAHTDPFPALFLASIEEGMRQITSNARFLDNIQIEDLIYVFSRSSAIPELEGMSLIYQFLYSPQGRNALQTNRSLQSICQAHRQKLKDALSKSGDVHRLFLNICSTEEGQTFLADNAWLHDLITPSILMKPYPKEGRFKGLILLKWLTADLKTKIILDVAREPAREREHSELIKALVKNALESESDELNLTDLLPSVEGRAFLKKLYEAWEKKTDKPFLKPPYFVDTSSPTFRELDDTKCHTKNLSPKGFEELQELYHNISEAEDPSLWCKLDKLPKAKKKAEEKKRPLVLTWLAAPEFSCVDEFFENKSKKYYPPGKNGLYDHLEPPPARYNRPLDAPSVVHTYENDNELAFAFLCATIAETPEKICALIQKAVLSLTEVVEVKGTHTCTLIFWITNGYFRQHFSTIPRFVELLCLAINPTLYETFFPSNTTTDEAGPPSRDLEIPPNMFRGAALVRKLLEDDENIVIFEKINAYLITSTLQLNLAYVLTPDFETENKERLLDVVENKMAERLKSAPSPADLPERESEETSSEQLCKAINQKLAEAQTPLPLAASLGASLSGVLSTETHSTGLDKGKRAA